MCFLKSCLSPAFRGVQITLHPSARCTPQPSSPPLPTFLFYHLTQLGAVPQLALGLLWRIPQHSTLPVSQIQEIYCTKGWMQTGFPAPFSIQRLVLRAHNSRGEGRAPALPTKALCMVVGEHFPTSLCLLPAERSEFHHKHPFSPHCIPGCWVEFVTPEAGGAARLGHGSGGGTAPAGPQ